MPAYAPPGVDMRRKRPPALSFLLRMDTARRMARVISLMALDLAGVFLAIFTALALKAAVRDTLNVHETYEQTKDIVSFAFLLTVLLFARSGLYANRGQRPGLPRIVACLFQVTLVALIFGIVNGEEFSSYYIFYGSLFFAVLYVAGFRYLYEGASGLLLRAAGYQRRTVLVGSGDHIEDVGHALADAPHSPINVIGFVSLTPRPDNGLKSLGRFEALPEVLREYRIDEVIIADPDFPQERAVELVDTCHQRGVTVRIAPSTMEILVQRAEFVPGASVPLFELRPPVFDGFDYFVKRTFDVLVSLIFDIVNKKDYAR
jgi:FlaA1/EpsC-like NDP-sugar epimerase